MEVAIRDSSLYQAGYASAADGMRQLGISAVELAFDIQGKVQSLADGEYLNVTEPDRASQFVDQLEKHDLRVCALLCAQNFNADERETHIKWVINAVRAAESLGAPAIRVDSAMSAQDALPLDDRIRIFADAVREVLHATPDSQVALGIENHGRQGNDPEWMRGVIDSVGSPRLGLTLDVGNWYWYGHPLSRVYEIYSEFGPLVKATHVKNIRYPEEMRETQRPVGYEYGKYCCPLDEGDLDMTRVASLLRSQGYDGPLTIEDESLGKYPLEERPAVLQRDVAHLKAAIRAANP